jgi:hypothetical protein
MSKSKGSVATSEIGFDSPGATHERILRVLGITQRPLQSGELANALGLFNSEAHGAVQWLTDKGYITGTGAARVGKSSQRAALTSWSLADKGRLWVKGQSGRAARGH